MKRTGKAGLIALCGTLSAVTVVVLLLASALPSGRLVLAGVSGIGAALALSAVGWTGGIGCYLVSGALSLLLCPAKDIPCCYLLLFGLYPLLKCAIEQLHRLWLEWVAKLCLANVLLYVALVLFSSVFFPGLSQVDLPLGILWLGANGVFICYDMVFTQLLAELQRRLLPLLKKQR